MNNHRNTRRLPQLLAAVTLLGGSAALAASCPAWLDHDFRKLRSPATVNICKNYAGHPLLIVNTASHCGYTPQFKALEAVHEKYQDRGLVVIGFPSDDFNQEAKDEAETAEICFVNYGVKFTMLSPLAVKGDAANPVFKELAQQTQAPDWNFNKYLVSSDGKVQQHYDSKVTPDSPEFAAAVDRLLATAAIPAAPAVSDKPAK